MAAIRNDEKLLIATLGNGRNVTAVKEEAVLSLGMLLDAWKVEAAAEP